MEKSLWPAATVAGSLIFLLTAVAVTSIVRYPAEDALKFWSALSGVAGVVTGAVTTFFFKQEQVKNAENKATEAKAKETETKAKSEELAKLSMSALLKVSGELTPDLWGKFQNDQTIKTFMDRASKYSL